MFDIQLLFMLACLPHCGSMPYLSNIGHVHALSSIGGSIESLKEVRDGKDSISILEGYT